MQQLTGKVAVVTGGARASASDSPKPSPRRACTRTRRHRPIRAERRGRHPARRRNAGDRRPHRRLRRRAITRPKIWSGTGVSDDDFRRVEAHDCPMSSCAAPAGSPCRTGKGWVASSTTPPGSGWCPSGLGSDRGDPGLAQAGVGLDPAASTRRRRVETSGHARVRGVGFGAFDYAARRRFVLTLLR